MSYRWPLQRDIVTAEDKLAMIEFLAGDNRLTAGDNVKGFERAWSKWLDSNRQSTSLFVQSGTAANYLLFAMLVEVGILKPGARVAMPTITWATTLAPLLAHNLEPVWIDIDPQTLTMNIDQLREKAYDFIWVTHLAGMANDMIAITAIAGEKGVLLAEDCCQAYGATVGPDNRKVGTFGIASTASFYFGHHMTTIEGGMLTINCQDGHEYYDSMGGMWHHMVAAAQAMRAHGLSREIQNPHMRQLHESVGNGIDNRFMFTHTSYNYRNTELNAVLGLEQLKRLNSIVQTRNNNFHKFTNLLSSWYKFTDRLTIPYELPNTKNSSFCLPFIFNTVEERDRFTAACEKTQLMETRPLAGGVLADQPAFIGRVPAVKTPHAKDLYSRTVYIGNNHLLAADDWRHIHAAWREAFE